jgi:hypothetical protein
MVYLIGAHLLCQTLGVLLFGKSGAWYASLRAWIRSMSTLWLSYLACPRGGLN